MLNKLANKLEMKRKEKNYNGNYSRKLRRLNLGGNELTKVPTQALRTLNMLKKLEMQENRIASIQEGDFEGTSTFISPTILDLIRDFFSRVIAIRNILATRETLSISLINDSPWINCLDKSFRLFRSESIILGHDHSVRSTYHFRRIIRNMI